MDPQQTHLKRFFRTSDAIVIGETLHDVRSDASGVLTLARQILGGVSDLHEQTGHPDPILIDDLNLTRPRDRRRCGPCRAAVG